MVDRTVLMDHLEMAERHVALGEKHVRQQRARLAALRHDGEMARTAAETLRRFEELQALHIADRDRLIRELDEAKRSVTPER